MLGSLIGSVSIPGRGGIIAVAVIAVLVAAATFDFVRETVWFVARNLVEVSPYVLPGIAVAGWVGASGAGDRLAERFSGGMMTMILVASAIGAVTPVCGAAVLPLMVSLLVAGVPFAPVMAFWLSSPITDPAMMAATAAMLGTGFMIAKTFAAFALGVAGGLATWAVGNPSWIRFPLRPGGIASAIGCGPRGDGFQPRVWMEPDRMSRLWREMRATTWLVLICLVPAFAAEHALQAILDPNALSAFVGGDAPFAVPIAVFFGAPVYLEGYAALPLVRGLMNHGMSPGAAMAFLVSGGVISVWGAVVIAPVLRIKAFALYLFVALAGSLLVGWAYGVIA